MYAHVYMHVPVCERECACMGMCACVCTYMHACVYVCSHAHVWCVHVSRGHPVCGSPPNALETGSLTDFRAKFAVSPGSILECWGYMYSYNHACVVPWFGGSEPGFSCLQAELSLRPLSFSCFNAGSQRATIWGVGPTFPKPIASHVNRTASASVCLAGFCLDVVDLVWFG